MYKITGKIDLEEVRAFMIKAHGSQMRSDKKTPYYTHPVSVTNRLKAHGITDDVVLATSDLHDVLEDTTASEADIEDLAGPEVLESVKQLTNLVKGKGKNASLFEHAAKYNDVSKRVKLADRLDNLSDAVFQWEYERVKFYAEAGLTLLDIMKPFPQDVARLEKETRTLIAACLM